MATSTLFILSLLYSLIAITSAVPDQDKPYKFFFAFGDSYVRPNTML